MGSDGFCRALLDRALRFNPRSHMGSDSTVIAASLMQRVSIHAPTWGATSADRSPSKYTKVSIHAPTWGATAGDVQDYLAWMFQSTLPHGERL